MSSVGEQYPPVAVAYELRFTLRALADLGVKGDVAPNDFETILASTEDRDIVEKFLEQRAEVPTGTQDPMRNVGRPDIYSLHGRVGQRSCTWFDSSASVCWFLGVVSEHEYAEFEVRAANGELLPSLDDVAILEVENNDFDILIAPGLNVLKERAFANEGEPCRGLVGGLLRLEVAVTAIHLPGTTLVDLFISVQMPPLAKGATPPEGWPGGALVEHIAELATGTLFEELECEVPTELPDGDDRWRDYRPQSENALVVRNIEYPET